MAVDAGVADAITAAIHAGDVKRVRSLLHDRPDLAREPLGGRYGHRTPLHVVTDWPGFLPNAPAVVQVLVELGADVDARGKPGGETPLHWAASNDDVHVARALLDAGADIDAADGSIGTPVANAVGYGCWGVGQLLVARGARVDLAWVAAGLGLLDELDALLGGEPAADVVSQALWHACAGGQRRAAELLVARGGDVTWVPPYASGTCLDAARRPGAQRSSLIEWLAAHSTLADP